ncbi:MAG: glycosyltransferase family 4 protein [Planctomycetaceae bacterium]
MSAKLSLSKMNSVNAAGIAMSEPKTLVVSYQRPSYSEVWMERMTNMLRPNVETVYFLRRKRDVFPVVGVGERFLLPSFLSRLPSRMAAGLLRRWIDREMSRVLKTLDKETRVLVHYVTVAVCIANAIHRCRNPVFVHCHGFDVTWKKRNERFPFLCDHSKSYVNRVLELSKRVTFIANSESTSDRLKEIGIPKSRIVLKYIGVPVPPTCPQTADLKRDEVSVLYLGRLTDVKGPVETVRAFARARELGMKGQLVIAGDGVQKKACENEVRRLGLSQFVEMLGAVSAARASELMAMTDIFTAHNQRSPQTGQEEAYGVSIVEAMAAGIPVVTGRNGGVCETVLHGETGILFDPGDIKAHAAALFRLSQDPSLRSTMGNNGFKRARDYFSLAREEQRLKEILAINNLHSLHNSRQDSDADCLTERNQWSGE